MKLDQKIEKNNLSLFGSEHERFISYLKEYQTHILIQTCTENCSENQKVITETATNIFFEKLNGRVQLAYEFQGKCFKCK